MTKIKDKRDAARKELAAKTDERHRADRVADRKRKAQFACMERSQRNGLTYREIGTIVGVSDVRVSQILTRIRKGEAAE